MRCVWHGLGIYPIREIPVPVKPDRVVNVMSRDSSTSRTAIVAWRIVQVLIIAAMIKACWQLFGHYSVPDRRRRLPDGRASLVAGPALVRRRRDVPHPYRP